MTMKTVMENESKKGDRDKGINTSKTKTVFKFIILTAITIIVIVVGSKINVEQLREYVQQWGIWASVAFGLRFTSVVFPALPGTAYSIFAGSLLGFVPGVITICLADLCSCSLSFYLSRRYGRGFVANLLGDRFIERIDRLSQKHLENNFFLMTGCLMTGFFDRGRRSAQTPATCSVLARRFPPSGRCAF